MIIDWLSFFEVTGHRFGGIQRDLPGSAEVKFSYLYFYFYIDLNTGTLDFLRKMLCYAMLWYCTNEKSFRQNFSLWTVQHWRYCNLMITDNIFPLREIWLMPSMSSKDICMEASQLVTGKFPNKSESRRSDGIKPRESVEYDEKIMVGQIPSLIGIFPIALLSLQPSKTSPSPNLQSSPPFLSLCHLHSTWMVCERILGVQEEEQKPLNCWSWNDRIASRRYHALAQQIQVSCGQL